MTTGGYPTDMFVSIPDRSLICAICLEVLCDPSQCSNGHLFCRSCAFASIEYRRQCPSCRCYLDRNNLSLSLLARDVVGRQQVYCTLGRSQTNGLVSCNWKGPLNLLPNHIEDECPLHSIKCSLQECTVRTPRHAMAAHLQRCPHRCKTCPYCDKTFSCLLINHHYKSCRFRPIICPNKCRRQPIRYCDMYGHLHRDCPEELVDCVYYATGCAPDCTGKVKRADYQTHTQDRDTMSIAIAALFRQVDELQDEVCGLRHEATMHTGGRRVETSSGVGSVLGRKRNCADESR